MAVVDQNLRQIGLRTGVLPLRNDGGAVNLDGTDGTIQFWHEEQTSYMKNGGFSAHGSPDLAEPRR